MCWIINASPHFLSFASRAGRMFAAYKSSFQRNISSSKYIPQVKVPLTKNTHRFIRTCRSLIDPKKFRLEPSRRPHHEIGAINVLHFASFLPTIPRLRKMASVRLPRNYATRDATVIALLTPSRLKSYRRPAMTCMLRVI